MNRRFLRPAAALLTLQLLLPLTGCRTAVYSVKEKFGIEKRDIMIATEKKEGFVRESQTKENRLLNLVDGLGVLWKDPAFIALLAEHDMAERPTLSVTVDANLRTQT